MPAVKDVGEPTEPKTVNRKLVIVGDEGSGKTSLLFAFICGITPQDHSCPMYEDLYKQPIKLIATKGKKVHFKLYDTSSDLADCHHRPLSYPHTDVALISFSVEQPNRFENVAEKWAKELRHHCGNVPIILVACKEELRYYPKIIEELKRSDQRGPIKKAEGKKKAKRIKALKYMECSAQTMVGVNEVFIAAADACLKGRPRGTKLCNIL